MDFRLEDIDSAEVDRRLSIVEPLADSVRDLIDAVIRTEVDDADLLAARGRIDAVVDALRVRQKEGAYGVPFTRDLTGMPWGNAAVGARNAVAPPMRVVHADGAATAEVELGAAYEGPAGRVHGGIAALLLDQLVGEAATMTTRMPCFTGTLTVKYVRPTALGRVWLRAEVIRTEGRKKFVRGTIADADGVTVEADAVMIAPKDMPSAAQIREALGTAPTAE
ncbi:PaaI family thioesterase [Gordonia shandongensis]|uniref:PaaI family thioesterase n=1 Tax=Gordonia shandongensis TaxID=376351 RepID=UPI0004797B2B|nr:PaaI family thioesterase [Gordonia shandongensis]